MNEKTSFERRTLRTIANSSRYDTCAFTRRLDKKKKKKEIKRRETYRLRVIVDTNKQMRLFS